MPDHSFYLAGLPKALEELTLLLNTRKWAEAEKAAADIERRVQGVKWHCVVQSRREAAA
jgi:hypothetical protein